MPISCLCGSAFGRSMTSQSVFVSNRYCLSPPKAGPDRRVRLLVNLSAFDALRSAVAFYLWGNRRLNPVNLVCDTSFPSVRSHAFFLSRPRQPVCGCTGVSEPLMALQLSQAVAEAHLTEHKKPFWDTRAFQCVWCFLKDLLL